jgi:hypothetical protein
MALALRETQAFNEKEIVVERPDGTRLTALAHANPICDESGRIIGAVNILVDLTARRQAEEDIRLLNSKLEQRIEERTFQLQETVGALQTAFDEIKTLRGMIPICAWCKKIRDDDGIWQRLESYLRSHTEAKFSHAICPACLSQESKDNPTANHE